MQPALVVVGDLVGEGAAQERGIIGETPNLAARLQALAEPDFIVTAESTRRLVGDLFEYRDLGLVELKGLPQPVRALRIVGESTVESRFEALHSSGRTAFIGREEETGAARLRRWQRAKKREGQAVLISGEPGIGKSWLAAVILSRSQPSLTSGCATFARHTTPIARFIQSSSGWSAPPGSRPMRTRRPSLISQIERRY